MKDSAVLFRWLARKDAAISFILGNMLFDCETRFNQASSSTEPATRSRYMGVIKLYWEDTLRDTAHEGYRHAIIHRGQLQCDPNQYGVTAALARIGTEE